MALFGKIAGLAGLIAALATGSARAQDPASKTDPNYHVALVCDGKPVELEALIGQTKRGYAFTNETCAVRGAHQGDKILDGIQIKRFEDGAPGYTKQGLTGAVMNEPGDYTLSIPVETEAGTRKMERLKLRVSAKEGGVPSAATTPEPTPEAKKQENPPTYALKFTMGSREQVLNPRIAMTEFTMLPSITWNGKTRVQVFPYLKIRALDVEGFKYTGFTPGAGFEVSEEGWGVRAELRGELDSELVRALTPPSEPPVEGAEPAPKDPHLGVGSVDVRVGSDKCLKFGGSIYGNFDGLHGFDAYAGFAFKPWDNMEVGLRGVHTAFLNGDSYTAFMPAFDWKVFAPLEVSVEGAIGQTMGIRGRVAWQPLPYLRFEAGGSKMVSNGARSALDETTAYGSVTLSH